MDAQTRETLRRLENIATPRPWTAHHYDNMISAPMPGTTDGRAVCVAQARQSDHLPEEQRNINANLIAAMRNALPELLALASAPLAGATGTCANCANAGRRFEVGWGGYQECLQPDMACFGRPQCVPLENRDGSPFGCTLHVPAPPVQSEAK